MSPIRVLDVAGTPFQMGYQHGLAFSEPIRVVARQRLQLCQNKDWVSHPLATDHILSLAMACEGEHYRYDPDLMAELEGISTATGLSLAELIITNGFTDFVDLLEPIGVAANCTTFLAGPSITADGCSLAGQTWDMNPSIAPHVMLMRAIPDDALAFLTFTITGCVGMIGMNEAGIGVCINNLSGTSSQPGVTWPFVIRKILKQSDIQGALGCILEARLAGGHNYLVFDAEGRGYNVEAMPQDIHVEPLTDRLIHANRCLHPATQACERKLSSEEITDSDTRYRRALDYLWQSSVTAQTLMTLTRDRSDGIDSLCVIRPEWNLATVGAVIMSPATRAMWCVAGLPIDNEYERFGVPGLSAYTSAVA